jgi:hypothetical protein
MKRLYIIYPISDTLDLHILSEKHKEMSRYEKSCRKDTFGTI